MNDRRSEYLKQLMVAISDPKGDFYEVQKVMDISFEHVPNELRRHFLEMHLLPDQFTLEEAKALWPAESASKAKRMLGDLKRYNLISETSPTPHSHWLLDELLVVGETRPTTLLFADGCFSAEISFLVRQSQLKGR